MRFLFVALALLDAATARADIVCELTLVDKPLLAVAVALRLPGAPTGETTLGIGNGWGGVEHPEDEVHALVVESAGQPLPVSHPTANEWVVKHSPSAPLVVHYLLVPARATICPATECVYRALVMPSFVHLVGNNALLVPDHLEKALASRIALRWHGFREAGWKTLSSFGADDVETQDTLLAFRNAVFIAAPSLHTVERTIAGRRLLVGVVGRWPFTIEALADRVARIIGVERAFFADSGPPLFVGTVLPVGENNAQFSLGVGLTHSFAVQLSPGRALDDDLTRLLAHELFHEWNGQHFRVSDPEGHGYWLSEGFTDFYARRLLYRAKLRSLADTVLELNGKLRAYYTSPARNAPNSKIASDTWRDPLIERLAYQRGDVLAMRLDYELRKRHSSLDVFMRGLVATERKLSMADVRARIAKATSERVAAELSKVVVDGDIVQLPLSALAPCLRGEERQLRGFAAGFDVATTIAKTVVSGVVPGSAAHIAGLRDGQSLVEIDLSNSVEDEPRPAKLTVTDKAGTHHVEFLPAGPATAAPQFVVADAARCADIL